FKNIDEKSVARDIVIKSFQKSLEAFKTEFVSLKQEVGNGSAGTPTNNVDNSEKIAGIESKLADLTSKLEKGEFASSAPATPAPIPEEINSKISSFEKNIADLSSKVNLLESRPQATPQVAVAQPSTPVDYDAELIESFENPKSEPGLGFQLNDLLQVMIKHQASDLHLKDGAPPTVRLEGELIPIGSEILSDVNCKYLVMSGVPKHLRRKIIKDKELDFAYAIPEARFRVHVFMQKGTVSASYRMIKTVIPSIETLHLPTSLKNLSNLNSGLILVTGSAGAGKTVTLTSMIDYMNTNRKLHIVTIEDPIEYIHTDKLSLVTQREIGNDTISYLSAIKSSLREDPNVIMIGELTDAETLMTAMTAAENGHLVLSSLYTPNAIQTITRLIDMIPEERKNQYRSMLSSTLKAVISQKLIPRADGDGRIPACEVLIVNQAISKLISAGKFDDIYPLIVEGKGEGMMTFSQSLNELCDSGIISKDELYLHTENSEDVTIVQEGGEGNAPASAIQDDVMMSWL
ncbi:PilT/PilU family type 4a pilus ATPase, partial [bacterium]|nr:PilT/PilU family type 4a pilus ATPase [bacterium]